jgi:GTP-binding protein EngB required for normal cell division
MNLRDYEHYKFALADVVRAMAGQFDSKDSEWQERFRDLFVKLAEDRFNLAFIGRFSRGKSSLINAILGRPCLPVDVVPLTSVITTVAYGLKDHVVLRFERSMLTQEIPLAALPQYVTQQGNPGNMKRIKVAEVQIRAELLRRGFHFVDTPGLGSVIAENTRATESFLPEADAFLVVTSFESPLAEEEIRILRKASASARKIFVAINKQDIVGREERDDIVAFIRGQLAAIFGEDAPRVFALSARDGLEAKARKDEARLKDSGLIDLEQSLIDFLLTEKAARFLLRMCARIADVASRLPKAKRGDIRQRLDALANRIAAQTATQTAAQAKVERFQCESPQDSEMALPALDQFNPCEICAHIGEAQWDFLRKYQLRLSVDPQEGQRFAEHGGLCGFHAWQMESVAADYGLCMSFSPVLDRLAARLRAEAANVERLETPKRIQALLPKRGSCVLCDLRASTETEAMATIAARLSHDEADALKSLSAICLAHFGKLAEALSDSEQIARLLEHQATLFERLSEDMRRHALKYNARRRGAHSEEEESAGHRALLILAGFRDVNPF